MIIGDDSLSDNERAYLGSVASNDVINLRNILEEVGDTSMTFNFDCLDVRRRSALHLAVENENVEIIELLIDKMSYSCIEEALLSAINKDSVKTVRAIIGHPSFLFKYQDSKKNHEMEGDDDDYHQFPHDVTPLILAAQRNNHEVIQMFLSRNFVIEKPHWVSCTCSECSNEREKDSLKRSRSRLNAYRALVSPAYMALSSPDPIMTTFELRQEMKKLAQVEKEFKNEYTSLVEQCMDFACELMDLCRGTQEVEAVLSDHATGSDPLARLKMALKYDEKKFVAHPNCQQHLTSVWYGAEMGFLQSMSQWKQVLFWILGFPIVPFVCLFYLACPNSKVARMLKCPASKFIAHTMSNLFFLVLISMATFSNNQNHAQVNILPGSYHNITEGPQRYNLNYLTSCQHLHLFDQSKLSIQEHDNKSREDDDDDGFGEELEGLLRNTLRSCDVLITKVHICLLVYIIGMMWTECNQLYLSGLTNYLMDNYNWIDFIVLSLYLSCYALKVIVHFKVASSDWFFDDATRRARRALQSRDFESFRGIVQETCNKSSVHGYYMRASRFEWRMNDPEIVSDMLFGLANVWSIARTTYLMPAFEVLGPLQISLGRMMADITRFLVLFALVLLAFMVGLHDLYCYYGAQTVMTTNNGTGKLMHSSEAFKDLWRTLLSLFWSMFGLVGLESIEIVHPHLTLPLTNQTSFSGLASQSHKLSFLSTSTKDMIYRPNSTVVVEGVGLFLFALYHVTVIIVLVNMLIAMMSHSFEAIQGDCDVEWKFARTNLWMNYMGLGDILPIPFNMIPSINSFASLFNLVRSFFRRHSYANIGDKDDVNNDASGDDDDDGDGGGGGDNDDEIYISKRQKKQNDRPHVTSSYCCCEKEKPYRHHDDDDGDAEDEDGNVGDSDDDSDKGDITNVSKDETETGIKLNEPKSRSECLSCFKTCKVLINGNDDCSVIEKFCGCGSEVIVVDNDYKDNDDEEEEELKVRNVFIVNHAAQLHEGNCTEKRNRFIQNETYNQRRAHHRSRHHRHHHQHQHHDHRKQDHSSNADILQRLVRRYLFKLERLKDETKDILNNSADATFVADCSKEKKDSDFRRKPLSSHGSSQSLVLNLPPTISHTATTGAVHKSLNSRVPGRSRPPSIVRRRHHQQLYSVQLQSETQKIEPTEHQQVPSNQRPLEQSEQIPSVNEPAKCGKTTIKQRSNFSPSPSLSPHSPLSPTSSLHLVSIPRIDAIMKSIKIFQTRVEQVDGTTLKKDAIRDDVRHVEKLLVENYKALSSLLLVLKSVHSEVEALKTLMTLKKKNASKVIL